MRCLHFSSIFDYTEYTYNMATWFHALFNELTSPHVESKQRAFFNLLSRFKKLEQPTLPFRAFRGILELDNRFTQFSSAERLYCCI